MSWLHGSGDCGNDQSIEKLGVGEYLLTIYSVRGDYDLILNVGDLDFVHKQMVAANWGYVSHPEIV